MRKKVLIVDDSLLMYRMYEAALKSYKSYEVEMHFASNGREGFVKLSEHPDTNLILLDINMPEISGLEFLGQAKSEKALGDAALILVSTEDQVEEVARGLKAGASGYLAKPFIPDQLHELLDTVLGDQRRVGDPS